MKISTRSRYGLRLMIQLAESYGQGFVSLRKVSGIQQISGKYLSRLVIQLRRHRLLITERGSTGGYALARSPDKITARMVVKAFERCDSLLPCARRAEACKRHVGCPSRPLWLLLGKTIYDTLEAVTLTDLAANKDLLEAKERRAKCGMTPKLALVMLMLLGGLTATGHSSSRLLYIEAQAVAGYSHTPAGNEFRWYSMSAEDVMQKPSLGFDILQRFSGSNSDWGLLALQARLAYDQEGEHNIEPQLYNAYLKIKAGFADIWLGHDRPAFGLSSYFDNHSLLLQPLAMNGFAYDRDWGLGLNRDLSWGDAAISLTTGSGMPLYLKGNYQLSARASRGVLSRDNFNIGFSASYGKPLETMGYHLMDDRPSEKYYFGADATWLWNNFENRFEGIAGRSAGQKVYGIFWRNTINLAAENRLKLEFQPTYLNYLTSDDLQIAAGLSYQITGDLTLRSMYNYDRFSDDHRVVLQLYWYHKIF